MSKKPLKNKGLPNRPIDDSFSLVEAIIQASPDLLFHLDRDGKIVDYIAGNSSALYTTPENFMGRRMVEVLPADVANLFASAIDRTAQSGEITSLEYELTTPAGFQSFEAKC